MRTMILALVAVLLACSGEGLSSNPDAGADGSTPDVSGPLAGHALVGRWVRTTASTTTEQLVGGDGSLLTRRSSTNVDTGCALVLEQRFAITVTGTAAGNITRAAGAFPETTTETCAGQAPVTTTAMRNYSGAPEPYSISGATLTLSTAVYQRAP